MPTAIPSPTFPTSFIPVSLYLSTLPFSLSQDHAADRPAIRDVAQALCENLGRVIITPSAANSNAPSDYDSYSYSGYDSSSYFTSGTYSGSESGSYALSGVASEGRGTAPGYMDPQYAFRGFYSQTFSVGGGGGGVYRELKPS